VNIDPALMTVLVTAGAGLITGLAQLSVALAGYLKSKANAQALVETNKKIDVNTNLTADIHKVTNGPLTAMGQDVSNLATQIATNAAEARSTAEAAKVQAAVNAIPSVKSPEKSP
jgi:hypothetical protein